MQKELQQALDILEKDFEAAKKKAIKEYCDAQNHYNVGSIFTDHIGSIYVDNVGYFQSINGDYYCKYYGRELTKKGELAKSGKRRFAFQNNALMTSL